MIDVGSEPQRGVTSAIAVVLLVATVLILAVTLATTVFGIGVESEPVQAAVDVELDDGRSNLVVSHESGETVVLVEGTDLVLVGPEGQTVLDDRIPGDSFEAGESLLVPVSEVGGDGQVRVVVRRDDEFGHELATYDVPQVGGIGGSWYALGGTRGFTHVVSATATADDDRTTVGGASYAVAVGRRTLYHQTGGEFVADDPTAGTERWNVSAAPTSNPVIHDGTVYAVFGTGGSAQLRGFDQETGTSTVRPSRLVKDARTGI